MLGHLYASRREWQMTRAMARPGIARSSTRAPGPASRSFIFTYTLLGGRTMKLASRLERLATIFSDLRNREALPQFSQAHSPYSHD